MTDSTSTELIVSHSRMGSWDRCKYAYNLSYVQGWKRKRVAGGALSLGSRIHEYLATGYRWWLENGSLMGSVEAVRENIKLDIEAAQNQDDLKEISRAGELVLRYFEEYAPVADRHWKPVAVEQHFQVDLLDANGEPFSIQGYIDTLMQNLKVETLWAWDHKSVGQSKFWTPGEITYDAQLPTYWFILEELGYDIAGILVNMLNTYEYKNPPERDKLFRREVSNRTEIELVNIMDEIGKTVAEIRMWERQDLPYRRSLKRDCATRCDYSDPCLFALKGIDPLPILEAHFTKGDDEEEVSATEENSQPYRLVL